MQHDEETQDKSQKRYLQVALSLVGFLLSVIFIFWGMLVLVRFWIYSNIIYNIFIFSMLLMGIVFNVTALNLLFSEDAKSTSLTPFTYGTTITIFWNIIGIILPFCYDGYYEMFSDVPFLTYSDVFYAGESFNAAASSTEHPFVKKFTPPGSSFFDHLFLIIPFMGVVLITQFVFWFYAFSFYRKLKREEAISSNILKTM